MTAEGRCAAAGPRQGLAVQPEDIGPLPVSLLVPLDERGPVDLLVDVPAEADQVAGVKTAAEVNVQLAGLVRAQIMGHERLPLQVARCLSQVKL